MSTGSSEHAPDRPLAELLKVAGPTVATMTSYTMMQFVDKWMVSRVDPLLVGAQGDGGLAAWVPIAVAMGCVTVINTYVSQNLGAGRPERGAAYAWNGIWIALAYWLVLLVPYGFLMEGVFRAAGRTEAQAALASSYGSILVFGAGITMATRAVSQFFYGMQKASVVMVAGVVANIVNLALTYALVFGKFGLPAMGLKGSAIGTVLATCVELAIPMAVFLGAKMNAKYGTRGAWRPSWKHVKDLLRLGWAGGLMFGNEMLCWGVFMVYLVGHFGPRHSTAGWIAHQYMSLSFMPAVGISVAVTATVGKCLGMGRPDLAANRAWLGLTVSAVYMVVCGGLFIVFREPMVRLFITEGTPPDEVAELVRLGSAFLIATAAFQFFDAIAMSLSGALRGAGDTVWPGVVTVLLSWGIIVGGGRALVEWRPEWESVGPWGAAAAYIAVLSMAILGRFLGGKWKTIKLVERKGAAEAAAGAVVDGIV